MMLGKNSEILARLIIGVDNADICTILTSEQKLMDFLRFLEANKFSSELISTLFEQYRQLHVPEHSRHYVMNKVTHHAELRKVWIEAFANTASALNRHGIKYMFIKLLRVPYVMLADIDILPKDQIELLKIISILHANGCSLYRFRLLSHSLKVMAKCKHTSGCSVDIDLYPSAMWIRKIVADNKTLFKNKTTISLYGVSVPVPSPPLDIYIVATHAYSHLRLSLAEILHILNLAKNIRERDWNLVMELASKFGSVDALYASLKLTNLVSRTVIDVELIPKYRIEELKKNAQSICNEIDKWLKNMKEIEFPVEIPAGIGVFQSSIYHCRTLLKNRLVGFKDLVNDFMSHYLAYSAIVLG